MAMGKSLVFFSVYTKLCQKPPSSFFTLAVALIFMVFPGSSMAVPSQFQLPANILRPSFSAGGLLGGAGVRAAAWTVTVEAVNRTIAAVKSLIDFMRFPRRWLPIGACSATQK